MKLDTSVKNNIKAQIKEAFQPEKGS